MALDEDTTDEVQARDFRVLVIIAVCVMAMALVVGIAACVVR